MFCLYHIQEYTSYIFLQPPQPHDVTATFVEIVGTVVDASTIKLLTCIDMGSKLGGSQPFPSRYD